MAKELKIAIAAKELAQDMRDSGDDDAGDFFPLSSVTEEFCLENWDAICDRAYAILPTTRATKAGLRRWAEAGRQIRAEERAEAAYMAAR